MLNKMKGVQFILAAVASVALAGACNHDDEASRRAKARVDQVEAEAKDLKDRAEKRTEAAKDQLDKKLEATKEAADRRVEEVKDVAEKTKDDVRRDVRGTDADLVPDETAWHTHWLAFNKSPDATWTRDDDYVVERDANGDLRAHRRVYDRPAGVMMDDGAVTTAVKGRLATDDDTRPAKIDVETSNGTVTLKGHVPNVAVAGEAVRLALGTKGVRTVVSQLSVK